jgi:hypothetical protein
MLPPSDGSGKSNHATAMRAAQAGELMNDTNLTFNDDADDIGGMVYIDRMAFALYTDSMNHTQEDEFNCHLDDLLDASNRVELAKYPFISLTRPSGFDRKDYRVVPLGQEHIELREWCEWAKAQTAMSDAKHHFFLMRLCGHPEEVEQLRHELTLSDEELCRLRRITDPAGVESRRESIAWTIRQVERMQKKYSIEEVRQANEFLDNSDADGRRLGLVDLD